MKTLVFTKRNIKEISRDLLSLFFGILFPILLILLLSFIQSSIPNDEGPFVIEKLAPGMAIFGLSFISLFSGLLISKDRNSSFMMRLMSSPMKSSDFIFGYILSLIPIALMQTIVCFVCAMFLGLQVDMSILYTTIASLPAALLYIGMGILCGSLFNEKQVGGVCGALLTNLSAWLSGIWFDVALVGGVFEPIANALPFVHAVKASQLIIAHDYAHVLPELLWVIGYAIVIIGISIYIFMKQTHK